MEVSLTAFKALLTQLKDRKIGLKVKTHTGWSSEYLRVIGFIASAKEVRENTFTGMVLSNVGETEGVLLNNIASITCFEIQEACPPFECRTVYSLSSQMVNLPL